MKKQHIADLENMMENAFLQCNKVKNLSINIGLDMDQDLSNDAFLK